MATDFWVSSHYKRWLVDRATVKHARAEDLEFVGDPEYLDFLTLFFADAITKLGKRLQLRQRAIATATVYFKRFYLKNSYCDTDPFLVIAACCYVAAKAEESPAHIKSVVSEARGLFNQENYNIKFFVIDNYKLAEMEFYLVAELECDLTVFHPYRTLTALCREEHGKGTSDSEEGEAGEVGVGIGKGNGPRYWGTGEGQLETSGAALQTAWFIINDSYRSDLCLIYPPHLIAIAAIYLSFIVQPTVSSAGSADPSTGQRSIFDTHPDTLSASPTTRQPRRSSRQASSNFTQTHAQKKTDPISFFAELNVSLPLIATIAQEIISLYALWHRYKEDGPELPKVSRDAVYSSDIPAKRTRSRRNEGTKLSLDIAALITTLKGDVEGSAPKDRHVSAAFLSTLLLRMRAAKFLKRRSPTSSGPVAVNKMLQRTQAVG